jgi:hypothetical protein
LQLCIVFQQSQPIRECLLLCQVLLKAMFRKQGLKLLGL